MNFLLSHTSCQNYAIHDQLTDEENLKWETYGELYELTADERRKVWVKKLDESATMKLSLHINKLHDKVKTFWQAPPASLCDQALKGKLNNLEDGINHTARFYSGIILFDYLDSIYSLNLDTRILALKLYTKEVTKATVAQVMNRAYRSYEDLDYQKYESIIVEAILNPELYNPQKPFYHQVGWAWDEEWLRKYLTPKLPLKLEGKRLDTAMLLLYYARLKNGNSFEYSHPRAKKLANICQSNSHKYFWELEGILFRVIKEPVQSSKVGKPAEIMICNEFLRHMEKKPTNQLFTSYRPDWGGNFKPPLPPLLPTIDRKELLRSYPIDEKVFNQRAKLRSSLLDQHEKEGILINRWDLKPTDEQPTFWRQGKMTLERLRRNGVDIKTPVSSLTLKVLYDAYGTDKLKSLIHEHGEKTILPLSLTQFECPFTKDFLIHANRVFMTETYIYSKAFQEDRIYCQYREVSPSCNRIIGWQDQTHVNLQNYPKSMLKHLIAKTDGYIRGDMDFCQHEPRIIAALSNDEELIRICNEGDLYGTLAVIFLNPNDGSHFDESHCLFDARRKAMKQFVHSFNYGSRISSLMDDLKSSGIFNEDELSLEFVNNIIVRMRKLFPRATKLLKEFRYKGLIGFNDQNDEQVYLTHPSFLGFSRNTSHLRKIRRGNIAQNAPVQSTAADMFVDTLINISEKCRENDIDWKLIAPMHDGFPFLIRIGQEDIFERIIDESILTAKEYILGDDVEVKFPVKIDYWDKSEAVNPFLKLLDERKEANPFLKRKITH